MTHVITQGSKVSLDYEGKLASGEVFDSSTHGDHSHPLEFVVGQKQVIVGFESAVLGLKVGDTKTFTLQAKDAYGEHNPQYAQEVPIAQLPPLPEGMKLEVGLTLGMRTPEGQQLPVRISAINEATKTITLDMNHPLAGQALTFTIKIVKVE